MQRACIRNMNCIVQCDPAVYYDVNIYNNMQSDGVQMSVRSCMFTALLRLQNLLVCEHVRETKDANF